MASYATEEERELWKKQHAARLRRSQYNREVRNGQRKVATPRVASDSKEAETARPCRAEHDKTARPGRAERVRPLAPRSTDTTPTITDGKATAGLNDLSNARGKRAYITEQQCATRKQYQLKQRIIEYLVQKRAYIPGRDHIRDSASIRDANLRWHCSKEDILFMQEKGYLETSYNPQNEVSPLLFPYPLHKSLFDGIKFVKLISTMHELNKQN